jgi:hypothetical protein
VHAADGFWYKGDRIVIPLSERDTDGLTLREQAMRLAHDVVGAHLGIAKTLARIGAHYWWPGMRGDVEHWIMTCTECQRNKPHHNKSQGLYQALPIPRDRWDSISMDFIVSLPAATGTANDCILVIVDRFTKLAKFIPCRSTLTAAQCVHLVLDHWVFQGGGIPYSIVSDRDTRFTSKLWTEFMHVWGVEKRMSTAFHPQTDGQTERMNRTLEEMLRHVVNPIMDNWEQVLPQVQFAYNSAVQSSTGMTPFMAAYGSTPRTPLTPMVDIKTVKHPAVSGLVSDLQSISERVRSALQLAQQRQTSYANRCRREREFQVGDGVLLSTQNLNLKGPKDRTMAARKLLPRFVGPFKVVRRVGQVAYELELPSNWRVHPVFHVSLLVPWHVSFRQATPPPVMLLEDGSLEYEVEQILEADMDKGKAKRYLVKWKGYGHEHNTWEPLRHVANCPGLIEEFWRDRQARTKK